jgi:hypothetical protein
MPASPDPANPLHNLLEEAETELSQRLREACEAEARGVPSDSAREIRQLEDSLLSAAMAAEKVLAVRRHLNKPGQQPDKRAITPEPPSRSDEDSDVREFEDETGRRWRAWPVTPDLARAKEASRRSLGDFQDGWFCFEALDNSGRRRLPQRGRRWSDLAIEELPRLLAEAMTVPERKTRHVDVSRDAGASGLN